MTVQEANQTPLSQIVKDLCYQARSEELYVLQFLLDEICMLEAGTAPAPMETDLSDWQIEEILEWVPGRMRNPKLYEMLTSEYVPYTEAALLELAEKAKATRMSGTEEEEIAADTELMDAIACNLTEYGWDEV